MMHQKIERSERADPPPSTIPPGRRALYFTREAIPDAEKLVAMLDAVELLLRSHIDELERLGGQASSLAGCMEFMTIRRLLSGCQDSAYAVQGVLGQISEKLETFED